MTRKSLNLLGAFLLALSLALHAWAYFHKIHDDDYGWDHDTYAAAVQAIESGRNPYDTEVIGPLSGRNLSFVYPAGVYPWLKIISAIPRSYFLVYGLCLAGAGFFLSAALREKRWDFFLPLLLTGYAAVPWNLKSGNIGLLEALWMGFALFLMSRERFLAAGIMLGYFASVKILPLFYVVPALLFFREKDARVGKIALGVGSGLILQFLIGMVISPSYHLEFYRQFWESQQHAPISELRPGEQNPTLFLLLRHVFYYHDWPLTVVYGIYASVVSGVLFFLYRARGRCADFLTYFSLVMVVMCPFLPRTKPYAFAVFLIPLYVLAVKFPLKERMFLAAAVVFLPILHFIHPFQEGMQGFTKQFLACSQALFSLATAGFMAYRTYRASDPSAGFEG